MCIMLDFSTLFARYVTNLFIFFTLLFKDDPIVQLHLIISFCGLVVGSLDV